MTCDQLLAYLSDYLDNALEVDLIEAAQTHLATCQHCQVVLNTTQQVIVLGHGQPPRAIPSSQRAHLMAQLQAAFLRRDDEDPDH
jgi:hypothetical protein